MVIIRDKFKGSYQIIKVGDSRSVSNRSDYLESQDRKSDKVSGGFLTLPDGSLWRKPTAYSRRSIRIEPGSAQATSGKNVNGNSFAVTSSAGGHRSDIILSSAMTPFSSPIGTVNRLNGVPVLPAAMRNEAATKALLDLANAKANVLENLATFRQTLNLLQTPASALAGGIKSVWANKSFRPYLKMSARDIARKGIANTAAQEYLKYVYGWKPLMSDIYGIIEMAKQQGKRPLILSGTGKSYQAVQLPMVAKDDLSFKCRTELGPCEESALASCKIYGRIDPNSAGLRSLNQLGLLNPLSLAWELVPWSFVVDWFVPIGPVLQALTAPAGLAFVSGTTSIRSRIKGPYEHWYSFYDAYAEQKGHATGKAFHNGYTRQTLSGWPLPGLWVSSNPFTGDRPYKALALTIISLRGLRI